MSTRIPSFLIGIGFITLSLLPGRSLAAAEKDYVKAPIVMKAKDILPEKVLRGKITSSKIGCRTTASSIPIG